MSAHAAINLLALNVGSATIKGAHFHAEAGGLAAARVVRAQIDVDPAEDDGSAWLSRLLARLPNAAHQADRIAHRVVHGGMRTAPALLSDSLLDELAKLTPMAPLHQPPALRLIQAARARWPQARQVVAFDTTWHAQLAPWSRRLPLPESLHAAGIVRYGFHGLAFQSVLRQLTIASPDLAKTRLVFAHLGGGSSLCAVVEGRSVDTTMGLTPLDGVPMATRSGSMDPGVLLHLARTLNRPLSEIEHMLWRESGLRGISGLSGDMRQLLADSSEAAALARDQFVLRVAQAVAAMATSLGGIDALVFSGGIGAGSAVVRQHIADRLNWMGIRLDSGANQAAGPKIDAHNSSFATWVMHVDEAHELALAALSFASDSSD